MPIVCSGPRFSSAGTYAAAAADGERDLEPALGGEIGDLEVGVQDLEVRRRGDVGRLDRAGALLVEAHLDLGGVPVQPADQVLQVEDDVHDVLADARKRGELVGDALDLHRGDCCALERREQHPPKRVAEGVAEAAVERLDHEDAVLLVDLLVGDLRRLEVRCKRSGSHGSLSDLLRVELDDELLLHRRVDLRPLGQSQRLFRSGSRGRPGATGRPMRCRSVASRTTCSTPLPVFIETTSSRPEPGSSDVDPAAVHRGSDRAG